MKKIALLILVAAAFNCCRKEKNPIMLDALVSKWEFREAVGGIWGRMELQPGNGNILEFKRDNSFAYSDKNGIYNTGTIDLQPTLKKEFTIIFHSDRANMVDESWTAMVIADSLSLWKPGPPECCDVISYYKYVRVN